MTTRTATSFPAGILNDDIRITQAGAATLRRLEQQPIRYHWDILALTMDGTVLNRAEIIDSHFSLLDACRMATTLSHMDRGKGIFYLVQRHPEEELPAAIEF